MGFSSLSARCRGMQGEGGITGLLLAWRAGDTAASDQLFPLVYDELRRIAWAATEKK